ncbi:MAG: MATE family efflux transporter [Lachnospiraceae bacterium]|nr:MATE family efflux transporter [Lachnospiraceae bacterium]
MAVDFAKGPVWKNIVRQAIPLTIAQMVQILYNIVDRIYIGHLPGAGGLALTGIGLTFPIVTTVSAFTGLFGQGGMPLFSIERGAGNEKKAKEIMRNSAFLLITTAVILTALLMVFKRPVLFAFGASEDTFVYANEYLNIYIIGTIFSMLSVGMNGYVSAQGFPRIGMLTVIIGAFCNIILDPILIFGFGMGVSGAAIATVISQFISALWVIKFLVGKKSLIKLDFIGFKPDAEICGNISALGMSNFIMAASNAAVQIACNTTLSRYGGDLYVGIMTVLNSIREIFTLVTMGIMYGAQPVMGYDYGAKKYDRVRQGIKFSATLATVYTLIVWVIIIIFPETFIRIFNNEADILFYGSKAIRIYFFGFVFMALQFVGQSTFVALGRSKQAIFFSLLRKVIIVVPLTLILPEIGALGVWGVFLAEPISNVLGGSASFTTMMITVWRKLNVQTAEKRGKS